MKIKVMEIDSFLETVLINKVFGEDKSQHKI